MIYDEDYYKHYEEFSGSDEEDDLMSFRERTLKEALSMVKRDSKLVVDYGCAAGAFLNKTEEERKHSDVEIVGVDIIPHCVAHCVMDGNKAYSPEMFEYFYEDRIVSVMTFWDTLEHLQDPKALLHRFQPDVICVSLPCLDGFHKAFPGEDIQLWKHHKPLEHIWSFTEDSFKKFLKQAGYQTVKVTFEESSYRPDKDLKDKNIMTFIARRGVE